MGDAKGPRWGTAAQFRIILLLSLGLNLFLGGYWVGTLLTRSLHPPGPGPERIAMIAERLRGKLSTEGMQKVDGLVADIESMLRSRAPGAGDVRLQLRQIVSENQFDRQRFASVIDNLNTARSTNDRIIADRIASVLSQLSVQDRRILADIVLARPPHSPPPHGR